jgi:spermidine/putrescine transport system ATP-binding protein
MRPPEAPLPEIRLVDLEKRFRDVVAVDRISLRIETGEFFSLLGPSGCGKTTTLRMIGGFEQPTGGRIELRGQDVTRAAPDKRPVNMVFQHYALFPHLDVGDNVAFGLRRKGVPKAEARTRVGEALELVRLDGYQRRRPNQLSGGQQQRVALARALVNRPNVLLLDEPLGALDLKLRRQLQLELKRIQVEVGITFVYVTHDQEEALTMSDRIAVMNGRPASRFVAGFIGTTNILSGTVVGRDGGVTTVKLDNGELTGTTMNGLAAGQPVELCIRPEAITLRPAPAEGGQALSATVEQAAFLGTTIQYLVRTSGGQPLTVLAPKAGGKLPVGADVAVSWSPAEARVLGGDGSGMQEEAPG